MPRVRLPKSNNLVAGCMSLPPQLELCFSPPTTGPRQEQLLCVGFYSPAVFCVRIIDDGFLDLRSEQAKRKISPASRGGVSGTEDHTCHFCDVLTFPHVTSLPLVLAMCLCCWEDGLLPPRFVPPCSNHTPSAKSSSHWPF